mmetsp:Transcript_35173/g.87981  ORF Transcript_35173/g.87981 Transcript_35173/m.87981 type:complete len:257 (-) Transcript_35173:241-1011(-)
MPDSLAHCSHKFGGRAGLDAHVARRYQRREAPHEGVHVDEGSVVQLDRKINAGVPRRREEGEHFLRKVLVVVTHAQGQDVALDARAFSGIRVSLQKHVRGTGPRCQQRNPRRAQHVAAVHQGLRRKDAKQDRGARGAERRILLARHPRVSWAVGDHSPEPRRLRCMCNTTGGFHPHPFAGGDANGSCGWKIPPVDDRGGVLRLQPREQRGAGDTEDHQKGNADESRRALPRRINRVIPRERSNVGGRGQGRPSPAG